MNTRSSRTTSSSRAKKGYIKMNASYKKSITNIDEPTSFSLPQIGVCLDFFRLKLLQFKRRANKSQLAHLVVNYELFILTEGIPSWSNLCCGV